MARTAEVASAVASRLAADVDARGRFPHETFEAAKRTKLLSACVPAELGGSGASMRELVQQCAPLASACGSSGMVLAMHHIQVACLARHALGSPYFRRYLGEIAERQLLLASVTSEVGVSGDTRSSLCAVERAGGRFTLDKDATAVSYGAHADDLLVTCRRAPEAPPSDQVLVLVRQGDFTLRQTSPWDTLGMRGTCSPGYRLTSSGLEEQIVPGDFADSSAQTMVPYSHILWSAVWLGLAADAVARAAAFVRAEARKTPGTVPPAALRLAELHALLQTFRNNVATLAGEFDALGDGAEAREALASIGWALKLNQHKIASAEMAPQIIHRALQIVGLTGYKNDTPYSVGRQYRDSLSAALMIGNDRIAAKSASLLLVLKEMGGLERAPQGPSRWAHPGGSGAARREPRTRA